MQLPIDRIANGVKAMAPKLAGSREAGLEAAKAIMTTATKKKEALGRGATAKKRELRRLGA